MKRKNKKEELLDEVKLAEKQIAEGKVLTSKQVKERLADRYRKRDSSLRSE